MRIGLTSLFLITAQLAKADATSNVPDAGGRIAVAVTVSGTDVRATVTEDAHNLTLSADGKRSVHVELPESERVSEVRIGRWMTTGVALAIEAHNTETKEISYFWATAWVNVQESEVGKAVVDRFFKSKIDYDVVGVVNSQGDSISITLLRHQRHNDSQGFDGVIYVNNCPVGPGIQGVLLPVAVNSAVGQDKP